MKMESALAEGVFPVFFRWHKFDDGLFQWNANSSRVRINLTE